MSDNQLEARNDSSEVTKCFIILFFDSRNIKHFQFGFLKEYQEYVGVLQIRTREIRKEAKEEEAALARGHKFETKQGEGLCDYILINFLIFKDIVRVCLIYFKRQYFTMPQYHKHYKQIILKIRLNA